MHTQEEDLEAYFQRANRKWYNVVSLSLKCPKTYKNQLNELFRQGKITAHDGLNGKVVGYFL